MAIKNNEESNEYLTLNGEDGSVFCFINGAKNVDNKVLIEFFKSIGLILKVNQKSNSTISLPKIK